MDKLTDQEILALFYKEKNNEYLGHLLSRYTLLLLGTCMKYLKDENDAKDAVQQIFVKVINELNKYQVDYFKTWLYTVTRNHCLMELRKNKYRNRLTEMADLADTEDLTEMHQLLEKEKEVQELLLAIDALKEEQANCIRLFYLKKMSYDAISSATGYSFLQVKSHIQNGKRNLKLLLENKKR